MMTQLLNIGPFKRIKRRIVGCCLIIVIAFLLACSLVFGLGVYLAREAAAQSASPMRYDILLLIDNSNSMYEKNGQGSDPDFLRIEAARLFLNYLGVDSGEAVHRLGVIFFGGEAQLVVPLTPLTNDNRRAELSQMIDHPSRMTWTNPQAALELAETTFKAAADTSAQHAVVLLTDGKPEWNTTPTVAEKQLVIKQLQAVAARFTENGIPIFIILLQNSATDGDPEITQLYTPLWQQIAAASSPGQFFLARRGEDLLDIYHNIVVTLTGRHSAGVVLQTQVETETIEPVMVEPGLEQVTFVIRKSNTAITTHILLPNSTPLTPIQPGVQYGGHPGHNLEEIWAISHPVPGIWQIRLNGQGQVTVWKDFYPAQPTSTFTATPPPTPSHTTTPTVTARPTATASATLTPSPHVTRTPTPASTVLPTLTSAPSSTSTHVVERITTNSVQDHNDTWGTWVGIGCIGLPIIGGGWLALRHRQSRPQLTGVLRLLTSHTIGSTQTRIDLDALECREFWLSSQLTDQTGSSPGVRLTARFDSDSDLSVVLVVTPGRDEPVLVNNRPIRSEWSLRDGDVIDLDGTKYKYENLRHRAPRK